MLDYLIRHVIILTPGGAPDSITVLPDHDIAIRGERIDAVLPTGQIDPAGAREVIDASGMLAMPGFINTHCHGPMVLFRGLGEDVSIDKWFNDVIWPLEANLTAEDVFWGAQLALAEMIESGVTTYAEHYFFMDEVARAVDRAGVRANLVWAVFSAGVPDAGEKLRQTAAWADRWQGGAGGRITTWIGPHAPYTCDEPFLRAATDMAKSLDVGIHIHVAETRQQVELSLQRYGKTPFGALRDAGVFEVPTIIAHATHPSDDDIRLMAEAGAGVSHCPKTFLKLAAGIAPVIRLRQAGIPVGIGTDGVVSNNTLDVLEQTRLAAMMQKHEQRDAEVLTIAEALNMIWRDGARVLRLDGPEGIGEIAPGKLADMILMRTDGAHMQPLLNVSANLLYSARASDVDTVFCNGKPLMRGRELLTLDKRQIAAEVRTRAERLRQRVPGRRLQTYQT